ncbi:protein-methionine-sulfoxide reductase catalytic subunit MsrP [Alphaproteobacteria bacterium]|nr:protein-methionine-sulfoxide reductase catalytic subunit MsrP [Alphaproteobacteria bacterium]
MFILQKKKWNLSENNVTPETLYINRRKLIKNSLIYSASAFSYFAGLNIATGTDKENFATSAYNPKRNNKFRVERDITPEKINNTYNNFYEFGSHKEIWRNSKKLITSPWSIVIDGMVKKEKKIDILNLLKIMPLEERVYRHRCVEAWAMTVPWSGFQLSNLINFADTINNPKYIQFETFLNPKVANGQKQYWYPWPYTESLTLAEAMNELSFIVTGAYGKKLVTQHGAPLRLAIPWKYGFKSIKSIVRITFTNKKPKSFWEQLQPKEYGFWANVNPEYDHPRWSQKSERLLGNNQRVPTKIYNGYGEFVANLYSEMPQKRNLFM